MHEESASVFCKGTEEVFQLWGPRHLLQSLNSSTKDLDNMEMDGHGCVPMKLSLQSLAGGQIWQPVPGMQLASAEKHSPRPA